MSSQVSPPISVGTSKRVRDGRSLTVDDSLTVHGPGPESWDVCRRVVINVGLCTPFTGVGGKISP